MAEQLITREIRHAHVFCGLGSGAAGFNDGQARVGNSVATFRCLGGIDNNPDAIADFERMTGVRGTVRDLFSLNQYLGFHGKAPPPDWREAIPADIHAAFNHERPHILFLSAPCKGFSGLLSETSSKTDKYQALNELTLRGMWLVLEAYADDPIELIIFENVPRIATRGRHLLDQIAGMLRHYGYAVAETTHDCGELGELAQSRKRFLLVARHQAKVPPFLYEPPKHRLRGVGEILDYMPLPGDPRGGPMHRMPALQWQTWVRLAFVEAGSDWRSLNKLRVEDGVLADYGIVPEPMRNAALGVIGYDAPAGAIIGESFPTNGRFAVADPRGFSGPWRDGVLGVVPYGGATGVITAQAEATTGRFAVADPRPSSSREGSGFLGVRGWRDYAGLVTANGRPGSGPHSVADPRKGYWGGGQAGVTAWGGHAACVTGGRSPLQRNGAVADPRARQANQTFAQYGVRAWCAPSGVVTSQCLPGGGPNAVADPRVGQDGPRFSNAYRIVAYAEAAKAVTGQGGNSMAAVADPRPADRLDYKQTKYRVTAFDEAAGTVIAASTTGNGGFAVADPRTTHGPGAHQNKMRVVDYSDRAPTITGSDRVGSGALSVADPRPACLTREGRTDYVNQRHYGVTAWGDSTDAVPAFAKNNNGPWSVADPRPAGLNQPGRASKHVDHYGVLSWTGTSGAVIGSAHGWDNGRWSIADPRDHIGEPTELVRLPAPKDRLVCVIRALDGTWHRPFTTLELAALQSLFDPEEAFAFLRAPDAHVGAFDFALVGRSDSAWRERIGNAVPRKSAKAIASTMGRTLLLAWSGETFMLSTEAIWVQPLEVALAVDHTGNPYD